MGIPNFLPYYQSRVPGLVQEGGEYRARCPLHQGKSDNSFALDPKTWRWFCHSGACQLGGDAFELEMKLAHAPFPKAKKAVEESIGMTIDAPVPIASARKPLGRMVATYDYFDADGTLLYQVCRFDPKDFRQRRPDASKPEGWNWSVKGLPKLLYRVPEVLATTGTVYLAEGEKDVDAIRDQLGLTATCNLGGAGKFTQEQARCLAGRTVVILQDDDEAGRKHARQVATMLSLEGCRIKIVTLPAKDPADWLAAGGTREQLAKLQAETAEFSGALAVVEEATGHGYLHQPPPKELPANVHEMLACYVVLVGTDSIFDRRLNRSVSPSSLKLTHGDDYKAWSSDKDRIRLDYDKLVFKPEGAAPGELNLYAGLPVLTARGRADKWFEHVHLMCGGNEELARWVISRLAFKLQNPGLKVASSIVFHGAQGTGKNLLFAPLMVIYGRYAAEIGQQQIDSPYTDWLSGKLLLVADEVASNTNKHHVKNKLKALITGEALTINEKFASVRWERNAADIHFLSNDEAPVVLETDDRRFCVIRYDKVQSPDYYAELAAVDPGALKEALLAWDCDGFHAHTKPPETDAKTALVALTKDSTDRFIDAWLEGDTPLPVVGAIRRDFFKAYDVWCKSNGERAGVQSSTMFSRLVGKRLLDQKMRAGESIERVWIPGTVPAKAEDVVAFQNALHAWITSEQRHKL